MAEKQTEKEPWTISVPEARAEAGMSKNAAYAAADRGEIPTIRFGRLRRVPVIRWRKILAGELEAVAK
jgi:hypothetical protein